MCKQLAAAGSSNSSSGGGEPPDNKELFLAKRQVATQAIFPSIMPHTAVAAVCWASSQGRGMLLLEMADYGAFVTSKTDSSADSNLCILFSNSYVLSCGICPCRSVLSYYPHSYHCGENAHAPLLV